MRLLQYNNNGEFSLTKDFVGGEIPEYAILSHTWGADTEEVTYRDLIDGTGKSKVGYEKIRFCGGQARRNDLHNFWVDTCCINKSSDRELSEAINSMFRWYRKAAKCYVYLTDVSTNDQIDLSLQPWEAAFGNSRWFTRGWTLQELIAPPSVEFFCSNGNRLGDKKSLEGQLHKITGIPVSALQSSPLSEFSFDERILWAQLRETKREEDKAYSLLGIFDISMPVIYGEGKENAFRRLNREWKYRLDELPTILQATSNCDKRSTTSLFQSSAATSRHVLLSPEASTHDDNSINNLPYAPEAPFNTYQRQHEPPCLDNTRVDILHEIYTWAEGQDDRCIFWLSGLAGTGKSTIARTIARRCFEETSLGASFFFSRGGGDISHAGKFFTSIARQLANTTPLLNQHICDAITDNSDIAHQSLRDQWQQLILRPISKLDSNNPRSSYLIVIDALDECDGDNDIRMIVRLLAEARSLRRVRLRIFLTSRPEIPIRYGLSQIPDTEYQAFVLHRVSPAIVDHDISLFLEYNLGLIGQELCLCDGWPGKETIGHIVRNASGLFIWAATACRFIRDGKRFAAKRLDIILHSNGSTSTAPEKHLDEIYTTVLKQSISPDYLDEEKEESYRMLKWVLGSVVILFSPLPIYSITRMLCVTKEDISLTLEDLHSILDSPKDPTHPIRLHHPSFRDFLLNKDRCGDFWVDEKRAHKILAAGCIQLMSQTLKKDICKMHAPGSQASQVENSRIQKCLPPEVQYACLYWVQHLQRSGSQAYDGEEAHRFLQAHLLHWLEALGWMGKTLEGIQAILSLEIHIPATESPNFHAFIHDAKRFALYSRLVIEQAPLQLYCSALVFAPEKGIVRKTFENYIPPWIQRKPRVQAHWSATLQTLEGHSDYVSSVAFSPDGKQLVSGSADKTVRLWDAATGTPLQTLEGHSSSVYSVAFSPDGKQLVSGSYDKTVRLWDATTDTLLQTLKGHSSSVYSIAFSPDSKQVVSGSADKTVRLWDAATGIPLQTLKGHSSYVYSIAFSPDSKQLVSGSADKTVRLWDATTDILLQTLKGHSDSVYSVAFSPDGKHIVSGSADKTVRLWDAATGTLLQTLEGHSSYVYPVAFSPNGKYVVSSSADKTVLLWDAATGTPLQMLKGHSDSVYSVAFSPDSKHVVSGSADKTVRLWDAATGTPLQTLKGYSSYVSSMAFSPDGKHVSGSADKTVRLWDAATGTPLQTPEGHSDYVSSVAFSPDSKQLVSGSYDKTVRLWDATIGIPLQTLKGHSDSVSFVAFSPDGKYVVSGSADKTVRLWDAAIGTPLQTLKGHSSYVYSVAFSPDGKQLVSGSYDKTVRLWDAATGTLLQTLKGHSSYVYSVAFSPNGKQLVSSSADKTVLLWDAAIGTPLQTLKGHSDSVYSVVFSPDGKQLVSGSADKTVRLWDAATGTPLQTLKGHSSYVYSIAFSPDGKQLVSGLYDKMVQLWDVATGTLLQTLKGHSSSVYSVAFSPDGKHVVSSSADKTVQLWDAATGIPLQTLKGYSSYVSFVAFSPDGKQVVSGSTDKTVRLWDAATGTPLQTLEGHSDSVSSVTFSPDGKQLVSSSADKTVQLWDAVTGTPLQTLEGHSDSVSSVTFSPDGKRLVSSSDDKTVQLWDAATGTPLQTLEGHSDSVSSIAFSPDGKHVVSGSADKTVRLWDAATGTPLQTLEGHSNSVSSVAFSPDGKHVVSGSADKTVRLWDAATGTPLAFLPDGHLLPTLRISDYWVVEGEANILWLPPDYRYVREAIWDQTIVFGHSLGRLSFLQFRQGPKLIV